MADFKDLLHSTPIGILILAGFGGLFFAAKVFSFVRLLFSCFVLSGTSLRKYGHKGSWAVVTGASDGIGKEFAMQLARQGYNIFLVSRTQSKLQSLAEELYSSAHVQTEILAMDFAKNRDEDFDRLKSMVEDLDVAILVNNVGKSHDMPVPFIETAKQEMNEIITINCIGTLKVTQIVAPIMVRRRRGLILTMGSFGGLCPTPLLATYSGSKAFLQQWSTALGGEMKKHGVDVELVMSYLVTSAMSKVKRPSLLIPTPRQFVKAALGKIGRSGGSQGISSTSTPYWSHAIFHWALATFIGLMSPFIIYQNRLMHEDIRKRALKKQEREAKKAT